MKKIFLCVASAFCKTLLFSLCVVCLLGSCSKDSVTDDGERIGNSRVPYVTLVSCTKDTKFTSSVVYKAVIRITNEGKNKVIQKGVKFGVTAECLYTSTSITNSDDAPQYTVAITPLKYKQTYYVKAFATNTDGTGYSSVISFVAK